MTPRVPNYETLMPVPNTPDDSDLILLEHYRDTQRLEGDQRLRVILSAERSVTTRDRQMTEPDRQDMLRTIAWIEDQLLPPAASPSPTSKP
jgi:hypothetical protein